MSCGQQLECTQLAELLEELGIPGLLAGRRWQTPPVLVKGRVVSSSSRAADDSGAGN